MSCTRLFLLVFLCSFQIASAQKTDHKLQKKLEDLISGFHGDIGIYMKDLHTGKSVNINGDTVFPTASQVKIPIMLGIMNRIQHDQLSYKQPLIYRDSLLYEGEDILGSFRDSEKIELGKVMMLMLTMSDNTASLWLQKIAGGGLEINKLLDSMGLTNTRVNSRTPGREANRSVYGWGQSSPFELVSILENIYNKKVLSPAVCDQMLRVLNRNYFDHGAVSQIPPYAAVFTKYGAVNQTRNEVLLVKGTKSLYAFSVMTKNNADQKWTNDNEAWELTRKISSLLWHYYEPHDKWHPESGAEKFY